MFNSIIKELGSQDILEQLNALELVEKVNIFLNQVHIFTHINRSAKVKRA